MPTPDKVTEPQLREYDEASAITAARIVRTPGGYALVVRVSWKPKDLVLYTQRGQPRTWASLDRMLANLAAIAPTIRKFDLLLDEPRRTDR